MAVSSAFVRTGAAVLLAVLGACSSVGEEDFFGYEDGFAIPRPDMVPETPDDKPGRTVDEMLDLKRSVTVEKAVYAEPAESDLMYEHAGRFGSKEKIALRKGLNAPDSGIVYGSRKRREAEVVRPLELKEREKDGLPAVSEEEILAEIIAPKTEGVEVIEVVSSADSKNEESAGREEKTPSAVTPVEPAAPATVTPVVRLNPPERVALKKTESVLPEVVLKAPEEPEKTQEAFSFEPLVPSEPAFKLIPPAAGNKIVLTPPSEKASERSVEIFLEE